MDRNSGNIISGVVREGFGKLYLKSWFRSLVRPFVRKREPEKWLFVVGCYNSGTTLLRRLLESHPAIGATVREGAKLTDAFPKLETGGWSRMMYANRDKWPLPDDGAEKRAARAQHDWAIWWPKKATVFFEKSIDHTTRVGWLNTYFRNTYFIGISRNPYCVNEGIARRANIRDAAAEEFPNGYSPELLAEQWVAFDQLLSDGKKDAEKYLDISYEALAADPMAELTKVFSFLNLDIPEMHWDGKVLSIGDDSHEIIDQNDRSLARLPDTMRDGMTPILHDAMLARGYTPVIKEA